MKMRTRLWSLAAALCMALASVAYAASGPVPALTTALAQLAPAVKHAPLAAIVAAAPATQAIAAAEHATASASEGRSPSANSFRQALTATATPLTAEVGLAGKVAAGKGCGKPPKKITA